MRGQYTLPGGPTIDVTLTPCQGDAVQGCASSPDEATAASSAHDVYTAAFTVSPTPQHPGPLPNADTLAAIGQAVGEVSSDLPASAIVERLQEACASTAFPGEEGDGRLGANEGDPCRGAVEPAAYAIAIRRAFDHALNWTDIDFEVIHGPCVDPVINVALDETLVEAVASGRRKPFLRMWEWEGPQVVLGSYQSYANELHADGVDKYQITVSRRVSGGGTMFMEAENSITFSLVVPTALVAGMSFEQAYPYLDQWVMETLSSLGVKARYVPLNDIASERGKIAGAAQKRWANGYMLHHVTMAYDMDSAKMLDVLRTGLDRVHDKGTRSAVKWVDPLRSQTDLPREAVIEALISHFTSLYGATPSVLTSQEIDEAALRCATKFSTPEWIYRLP